MRNTSLIEVKRLTSLRRVLQLTYYSQHAPQQQAPHTNTRTQVHAHTHTHTHTHKHTYTHTHIHTHTHKHKHKHTLYMTHVGALALFNLERNLRNFEGDGPQLGVIGVWEARQLPANLPPLLTLQMSLHDSTGAAAACESPTVTNVTNVTQRLNWGGSCLRISLNHFMSLHNIAYRAGLQLEEYRAGFHVAQQYRNIDRLLH